MKKLYEIKSEEEIKKEAEGYQNPFGLVYDDAIVENIPGEIQIQPISYDRDGIKAAANLYFPAGYSEEKSYPALVVAHPNGGVKEQVAGLFGQKLAEQGYITLVFDAAYQGASGGEPRSTDKPQNRVEDIHRAADVLLTVPGVDPERLGALGICGGGGYTFKAIQTDKRFKAASTLSLFNSDIVRKNGFLDSQIDTIQERLEQAAKARNDLAQGKVTLTPNMCEMPESEADKLPYDLYREGYYYYGKQYPHKGSTFSYTLDSLIDLMDFDARQGAELINIPLLMIAGKKADTLYLTEGCYSAATGTKDKELFLVPGAHHIETYWKPEYVQQEAEKMTEFFDRTLKNRKAN
ncbi:alpha/beta hydrolase [Erysipelotrichaceae bacterium RD49]|nr:alpha/beta hydrolase [Erysipelotrichaceae bacterium RD49]